MYEEPDVVNEDVVATVRAEDLVEAAPVSEAAPARKEPVFSREGVLLNPQDCVIGADGIVRGKD